MFWNLLTNSGFNSLHYFRLPSSLPHAHTYFLLDRPLLSTRGWSCTQLYHVSPSRLSIQLGRCIICQTTRVNSDGMGHWLNNENLDMNITRLCPACIFNTMWYGQKRCLKRDSLNWWSGSRVASQGSLWIIVMTIDHFPLEIETPLQNPVQKNRWVSLHNDWHGVWDYRYSVYDVTDEAIVFQ
jgi:hypothetical protein